MIRWWRRRHVRRDVYYQDRVTLETFVFHRVTGSAIVLRKLGTTQYYAVTPSQLNAQFASWPR